MKRSTFITWDQLKVGAMIAVAIAIMIIAILKLGESAKLFTKRYTLVTFVPSAGGTERGRPGDRCGTARGKRQVDRVSAGRPRHDAQPEDHRRGRPGSVRVRCAATPKATLRSLAILGDKVFDITPGTPDYPALRDGDTLTLGTALDYEAVLNQASGALGTVVSLTGSLQKVVNGVTRGDGTIGALVTSRQLYDQLNSTLASTNGLMVRLQSRGGTIGRLLDDPAVYNSLNRVLGSADTVVAQINSSQGTFGKLLRDDQLYTRLISTVSSLDTLAGTMARGNGTMTKLFTDQELYDKLLKTVTELNNVLIDVRRDPRRYTKGLITVF